MCMLKEENSEAQSQLKVFFLELTDFFSLMKPPVLVIYFTWGEEVM